LRTSGGSGRTGAMNAQCFFLSWDDFAATSLLGALAPWSIQERRTPISCALNRSPLGGIGLTSSKPATALTILLAALLPGTMTGPESPPLRAAAAVSSRRPERCLSGPWQA